MATSALPLPAVGLLDRERTVAKPGFNRWLVPPAALAIRAASGPAYGLRRVLAPPIQKRSASRSRISVPGLPVRRALPTTTCDWHVASLAILITLFFVFLGSASAIWGGWLRRVGHRRGEFYAAMLLVRRQCSSPRLGCTSTNCWLIWLGSGVIGGIQLGLGYISPVSTLIKWFPDRRGMATGMAIMGFGGGAMIGSPLAEQARWWFKTPASVGVWQTLVVLAVVYFICTDACGAFDHRGFPRPGSVPEGWTPPAEGVNARITTRNVHLRTTHKTPQFWLIWARACASTSAGIGVLWC